MRHRIVRWWLTLLFATSLALAQPKPIPQLVKKDGRFQFLVDG
jgi:hypothetical protein